MITKEELTKNLAIVASDPQYRKFWVGVWCKLHKDGCVLPTFDEAAELAWKFSCMTPDGGGDLTEREECAACDIKIGLHFLAQLAWVKENM